MEFKLNFYFCRYKDKKYINRDYFRKRFRKENGEFQYLRELILMVEKYQMSKYGSMLQF